jgi:hypothetical protein
VTNTPHLSRRRPDYAVEYYIDRLPSRGALHGSFQLYRAFGETAQQNDERRASCQLRRPG